MKHSRRSSPAMVQRRKLNLKAKLESSSSYFSFKRLVPGSSSFQRRSDRVNLHRRTMPPTPTAFFNNEKVRSPTTSLPAASNHPDIAYRYCVLLPSVCRRISRARRPVKFCECLSSGAKRGMGMATL
jgi:hypothetical protein